MKWFKVADSKPYTGGISEKVVYAAIKNGKLKAARIGAGRNVLLCEEFVDEWLQSTANEKATTK